MGYRLGRSTGLQRDPATTTTLTASKNPSGSGESVNFTATVKSETNGVVAQGGAQFVVDGTPVAANVPLNVSGQAVFTASWLTPGSQVVTANYLGAQSFSGLLVHTEHGLPHPGRVLGLRRHLAADHRRCARARRPSR